MLDATIVIPSWDAAKLLEQTLPSALQQTGVEYEILVVDNGSPRKDTAELVASLARAHPGRIRCIELPEQAGYTGAVNAGVAAAETELVAVLGNDNIVPPDWLASLVTEMRRRVYGPSGRRIGAVMSQTIVGGQEPPGPCTLNHFGRNIFYRDDSWTERVHSTFYPGGNSFLYDQTELGLPFEDFYFAYHEDVSLGWRARLRGLEVLQTPRPRVASFDGGSTKRKTVRERSLVLTERNRLINCLTFPESGTIAKLAPLLFLDGAASLLFGKNRLAKLKAWGWIALHAGTLARLREKRQAERRLPDSEALAEISWNYFSTAGGISPAKRAVNAIIAAYMRCCLIPGRRHD